MTLKKPARTSSPVFDIPPAPAGIKGFLNRRLVSLAGKPLLAEKNLPIQPSAARISRKCYSISDSILYKFRPCIFQSWQLKPIYKFTREESIAFENHPTLFFAAPKPSAERPVIDFASPIFLSANTSNFALPLSKHAQLPKKQIEYTQKSKFLWQKPMPENVFKSRSTPLNLINDAEIRMRKILAPQKVTSVAAENSPANQATLRKAFRIKRFPVKDTILASCYSYRSISYNFTGCSIIKSLLPVSLHDTTVCESMAELKFNLSPASRLQRFKTFLKLVSAKFTPGSEIDGNFVLESKISFKTACNNRLGQPQKAGDLKLEYSGYNKAQPALTQSLANYWPAKASNPAFKAIAKIASEGRQKLVLHSPLQTHISYSKTEPECIYDNSSRFSGSSGKTRLKLRLKLRRQPFSFQEFLMKPLVARSINPIDHISRPFVAISYLPLKRAINWSAAFEQQWNDANLLTPETYLQKRCHFFIKSAAHARYTLKSLRKLRFIEAFKRSRTLKLSTNNLKLLGRPIKQVLPIKFPVGKVQTRPYSAKFSFTPEPFKMLGKRPDFADIQVPMQKRWIKTTTGNFCINLHSEQLKRRKKSLRMLRFKLQIINEGFQDKPEKILRRLSCPQSPFSLEFYAEKTAKFVVTEKITTRFREKPLQSIYQLHMQKISVSQRLPAQLQVMLTLPHILVGIDAPVTLPQKNFIIPSLWKPANKAFNCRLRLLPHPFGFPDFRQLPPRFDCLQSPMRFAVADFPDEKADLPGHFILRREKVYLPPTSMKNPRKLLFKGISPANSPREFYIPHKADQISELNFPSAIESFNYPWKTPGDKTRVKSGFSYKQTSCPRQKAIILAARSLVELQAQYCEGPAESAGFKMPGIKRMLLRARRFGVSKNLPEPGLNASLSQTRTAFKYGQAELLQSPFRKYELNFGLYRIKDSFFTQNFSTEKPAPVYKKASYRARFRVFRFPYRPEVALKKPANEIFCLTDQLLPSQECEFADEVRTSEFVFQIPEISGLLPFSAHVINLKPKEINVCSFNSVKFSQGSPGFTYKQNFPVPKIQDSAPSLYHFINPDTFFKFSEKAGMRLKKVVRSYNFKHQPNNKTLLPAVSAFSEFGLKNAPIRSLAMDSLHWIILLRSYINLDKRFFSFISESSRKIESPFFAWAEAPTEKYYLAVALPTEITKRLLPQESPPKGLKEVVTNCLSISLSLFPSFAEQRVVRDCCFVQQFSGTRSLPDYSAPIANEANYTMLATNFIDPLLIEEFVPGKSREEAGNFELAERKSQPENILQAICTFSSDAMFKHANMPDWIDMTRQRPVLSWLPEHQKKS